MWIIAHREHAGRPWEFVAVVSNGYDAKIVFDQVADDSAYEVIQQWSFPDGAPAPVYCCAHGLMRRHIPTPLPLIIKERA